MIVSPESVSVGGVVGQFYVSVSSVGGVGGQFYGYVFSVGGPALVFLHFHEIFSSIIH